MLDDFVFYTSEFFSSSRKGSKNCLAILKGCEEGKMLRTTALHYLVMPKTKSRKIKLNYKCNQARLETSVRKCKALVEKFDIFHVRLTLSTLTTNNCS